MEINKMTKQSIEECVKSADRATLTEFAYAVITIDAATKGARKADVKTSEYKPEHFDKDGMLTEEGLKYTKEFVAQHEAVQGLFFSYLRATKRSKIYTN
jgi:hypothetical protein